MANLAPTWTLGDRLAKARDFGNVSVEHVMAEAGISRRTVTNYENDNTRPTRAVLLVYAQLCGVALEWLETGSITLPDEPVPTRSWNTTQRAVWPIVDWPKERRPSVEILMRNEPSALYADAA